MTVGDPFTRVEVLDIRPVTGMGALRALVTVRLGPVTIRDCRVIKEDGKRPWASLPQVRGGDRWYPLIQVSDPQLHGRILQTILDRWLGQGRFDFG